MRKTTGAMGALVGAILLTLVTTPHAQSSGQCGYLWIGGGSAGGEAFGWAFVEAYNFGCEMGGYDVEAFAQVGVSTPMGLSGFGYQQGYNGIAQAEARAPLQQGEAGWVHVEGVGAVCMYFCMYGEGYSDSYDFLLYAPPPDPHPPTLSLSPYPTHTVNQNFGHVTITATVSNPEYGPVVWSDDGIDTGDPLSRIIYTTTVGEFEVTATLGDQTRTTVVKVLPVGPAAFRISLNAYIPYDNLNDPIGVCCSNGADPHGFLPFIGIGDGLGYVWPNRDPTSAEDRSVKVSDLMSLWNYYYDTGADIFLDGSPTAYASATQIFETASSLTPAGTLKQAALDDWEFDDAYLKVGWALGLLEGEGCSAHRETIGGALRTFINCHRLSPNGMYWWVPGIAIEYDLTINVAMLSPTMVEYAISGCHKNYPMYQFWIGGDRVYSQVDGEYSLWLLWPCSSSTQFEDTGTVPIQ